MNTAKEHLNTSYTNQSRTPFYSLNILSNVSSSSQLLYIKLRNLAGCSGYISKSVRELKYLTGKCDRQTRRLIHELESHGLIEIWKHEGFENEIIITDVYFGRTLDKKIRTFKSKTYKELTVSKPKSDVIFLQTEEAPCSIPGGDPLEPTVSTNVTVSSPAPVIEPKKAQQTISKLDTVSQRPPVRMDLVAEILTLTGDKKSIGFWIKFVRSAPLPIVYCAIASLKASLVECQICHRGKYFVGIIRRIFPEMFQEKRPLRQPQDKIDVSISPWKPHIETEPPVDINWDLNKNNIQQIRAMLSERKMLLKVL